MVCMKWFKQADNHFWRAVGRAFLFGKSLTSIQTYPAITVWTDPWTTLLCSPNYWSCPKNGIIYNFHHHHSRIHVSNNVS